MNTLKNFSLENLFNFYPFALKRKKKQRSRGLTAQTMPLLCFLFHETKWDGERKATLKALYNCYFPPSLCYFFFHSPNAPIEITTKVGFCPVRAWQWLFPDVTFPTSHKSIFSFFFHIWLIHDLYRLSVSFLMIKHMINTYFRVLVSRALQLRFGNRIGLSIRRNMKFITREISLSQLRFIHSFDLIWKYFHERLKGCIAPS